MITFTLLWCALSCTFVSYAQFSNDSFEQWNFTSGFLQPTDWNASNDADFPDQVSMYNAGHTGSRSLMLSGDGGLAHPAGVWQEHEIDFVPVDFHFCLQGHLTVHDTLMVICKVEDAFGNELFQAEQTFNAQSVQPGWCTKSMSLVQVGSGIPNKVVVHFHFIASGSASGFALIDDAQVSLPTAITDDDDSDDDQNNWRVWKDSNSERLLLAFPTASNEQCVLRIYGINGQLMHQENLVGTSQHALQTSAWMPGVYIVHLETAHGHFSKRIFI